MKNAYLFGWMLVAVACGNPNLVVEDLPAATTQSITAENSLNLNSLNLNSLNLNSLNLNSLNLNSLNLNSLNLNSLGFRVLTTVASDDLTGTLTREALKYMVSCAFTSDQVFTFSWTDSLGVVHTENYPGLLGIAPDWQNRALTQVEQRMVSACLAARVNYYQIPVTISSRSKVKPLRENSSEELTQFPNLEGAFWGDLFSSTPYINACFNRANIAHSRALYRDCAAGHVNTDPTSGTTNIEECGIIRIVGDCATVCGKLDDVKGYYWSCPEAPGSTSVTDAVITTALQ